MAKPNTTDEATIVAHESDLDDFTGLGTEAPKEEKPDDVKPPDSDIAKLDEDEEEEKDEKEEKNEEEEGVENEEVESDEASDEGDEGEASEDEVLPLVETLKSRLGLEGDFDESEEGVEKLVEAATMARFEEELSALREENAVAADLFEYVRNGGEVADFMRVYGPETDWSKIELKEEDTLLQEKVVVDYLIATGETPEDAKDQAGELKAAGLLYSRAQKNIEKMKGLQEKAKADLVKEQKELVDKFKRETQETLDTLNETIDNTSEVLGLPLTEKAKRDMKAAFVPNAEGITPYQQAAEAIQSDPKLAVGLIYLILNKLNIDGAVARKASEKKAKDLRDRLKNNQKSTHKGGTRPRGQRKGVVDVEGITFDG